MRFRRVLSALWSKRKASQEGSAASAAAACEQAAACGAAAAAAAADDRCRQTAPRDAPLCVGSGEDPFELKKLAPRPLLTVPADAAAAASVEAKNADITHSNDTNKKEYDARLREIKNRVAQKLKRALRPAGPALAHSLLANPSRFSLTLRYDHLNSWPHSGAYGECGQLFRSSQLCPVLS